MRKTKKRIFRPRKIRKSNHRQAAAGVPAAVIRKEDMVKKVTLFYLINCPYCKQAHRAIEELTAEKPAYKDIPIDYVEESMQPSLAEQYDYYYVPTMFFDHDKQYEAHPGESYKECRENIRKVFEAALA